MRRLVIPAVLCAASFGCGNWARVGSGDQPSPSESLTRALNTTQYYQRLGRLAAGDPLPFVGTVAFAAAPADSVIGVLGLSLENRALAFQREGNVFVARYRVSLSFRREGAPTVDRGTAPVAARLLSSRPPTCVRRARRPFGQW